jgi:hypothetical protein
MSEVLKKKIKIQILETVDVVPEKYYSLSGMELEIFANALVCAKVGDVLDMTIAETDFDPEFHDFSEEERDLTLN